MSTGLPEMIVGGTIANLISMAVAKFAACFRKSESPTNTELNPILNEYLNSVNQTSIDFCEAVQLLNSQIQNSKIPIVINIHHIGTNNGTIINHFESTPHQLQGNNANFGAVIDVLPIPEKYATDHSKQQSTLIPIDSNVEIVKTSNKKVGKIDILSCPIAACRNERLTPELKVKLLDSDGNIIKNRKVRIEIHGENGIQSIQKMSGTFSKETNDDGIAMFDDLTIMQTGVFEIHISSGSTTIETDEIDIHLPCLPVDFWNWPIGSDEYEERLNRALNPTM